MSLYQNISDAIKTTISTMPEMNGADLSNISVETPKNREFGDFSTNAAMVLTKQLGKNPRAIAEMIVPKLALLPFAADVSIAGPGFVNIKLKDEFIIQAATDYQLPNPTKKPQTIDMDYGAYNIAKALHIGHLRTSIVGDTLYRIAKFLGHNTISYNHMGDWGRPMALVIAWIETMHPDWPFFQPDFDSKMDLSEYKLDINELNTYYPAANARAKEDADFLAHVQQIKASFQDGHPGYTALYKMFSQISIDSMMDIIRRLNMLPFDNNLGEQNAAKYLPDVEKILRDKNLIEKDDGAEIIVVKKESDNAPMPPMMFYDSRGADTYDSTDIAALYYRKITDNPDKVIYLTDVRQSLHFQQLFRVAEMADIMHSEKLEHLGFGKINGADGKVFKTRGGDVPELSDMIDMANDAVRARVTESGKKLPDETIGMVGLAALKFNDLMHDVKSDYIFDPDAVTQFEGRTGPYILYTAVRLNSVLKKAGDSDATVGANMVAQERDLLMTVLDFDRMINKAFDSRATDMLANYTYDLAQSINTFYHHCPILADNIAKETRAHRLGIVRVALLVLSKSIELMGLQIPEEM